MKPKTIDIIIRKWTIQNNSLYKTSKFVSFHCMSRCNFPAPLRFKSTFVAYVQRHANLQARLMAATLRVKSLQAGLGRDAATLKLFCGFVRGEFKNQYMERWVQNYSFRLYNINMDYLAKEMCAFSSNFKAEFPTRCLRPQCFKSLLCQTQKGCTACYLQHLAIK